MLSRKEMIELLEEYGIHNDKELDDALEKLSVKFAIFADRSEVRNGKENIQNVS